MDFLTNYIDSEDSYLEHHGILGQKWGVRRYQNPNGTLTRAGRRRFQASDKKKQYLASKTKEYYKKYKGQIFATERAGYDATQDFIKKYGMKELHKEAAKSALATGGAVTAAAILAGVGAYYLFKNIPD